MYRIHEPRLAPEWFTVKRCNQIGDVPLWTNQRYRSRMKNGIRAARERQNLSQTELARAVGTTRQQMGRLESGKRKLTTEWAEKIAKVLKVAAQELMFPDLARIDTARFRSVFEVAGADEVADYPTISLGEEFLRRMLPSAARNRLQLMMVDSGSTGGRIANGDAIIIDLDDVKPIRPGLYAVEIQGAKQWRFLNPTIGGLIQVAPEDRSDPAETVEPSALKVIGRAKLRISTL